MTRSRIVVGVLAVAGGLVLAAGCAAPNRTIPAVPEELADAAQVPHMGDVRGWGDGYSPAMERSLAGAWKQRRALGLATKEINALTMSGGGPDGAYGAGILCGWTRAGKRPVFDVVTGISTGALIAPFAFLGGDYDQPLRDFYTTVTTNDVLRTRPLAEIFASDAVADSEPLARLLAGGITPAMLQAIARQHAAGRRLFIGTTNLDAQRPVIWDMGAIASSGRPEAIDLFRKVMLASASVPVAFSPQYIDVEADGRPYQEMHVDGGAMTQVFHAGQMIDYGRLRAEVPDLPHDIPSHTYVIRNGFLRPEYQSVPPRLAPIAVRALGALLRANTAGDLHRVYTLCQMQGMDFHLAYIPDDHRSQAKELFDRAEMTALFELGFQKAQTGTAWTTSLPGRGPDTHPAK